MEADSHFIIGSTHASDGMPCQDYARSLVLPGAAIAIVSDGCSTGGATDNGARIVTHAAAQALRHHWSTVGNPFAEGTMERVALQQRLIMANSRTMLGLTSKDMLATSMYAYYTLRGGFAHVLGDGVVAWQGRDGSLGMVRYEWLPVDDRPAAPFYPEYYEDDCQSFIEYYNGDLEGEFLRSELWVCSADGTELIQLPEKRFTLSEGIQGPVLSLAPDLLYVAVFTDGVTQVEGIDWTDAVRQLLAFKNTNGVFARRRMGRFYKEAKKLGRGAMDDLSYAVIRTDDELEDA